MAAVNYIIDNTPVTTAQYSTTSSGIANPLQLSIKPTNTETHTVSATSFRISGVASPGFYNGLPNAYYYFLGDGDILPDGVLVAQFRDSGTAGEVGNVVIVDVHVADDFIMPGNNHQFFLDIDGDADEIPADIIEVVVPETGTPTIFALNMVNSLNGFNPANPAFPLPAGTPSIAASAPIIPGAFGDGILISSSHIGTGGGLALMDAAVNGGPSSSQIVIPQTNNGGSPGVLSNNCLSGLNPDTGGYSGTPSQPIVVQPCFGRQRYNSTVGEGIFLPWPHCRFTIQPQFNSNLVVSRHFYTIEAEGSASYTGQQIRQMLLDFGGSNSGINPGVTNEFDNDVASTLIDSAQQNQAAGVGQNASENWLASTRFGQTIYYNPTVYLGSDLSQPLTGIISKIILLDTQAWFTSGGSLANNGLTASGLADILPDDTDALSVSSNFIDNRIKVIIKGLHGYIIPEILTDLYFIVSGQPMQLDIDEDPDVQFNFDIQVPFTMV